MPTGARERLDPLVDFREMDGYAKAHAHFDLLDDLEGLLGTKVDLVPVGVFQ